MSFREKSAWVTLFSILLVTAAYFLFVPSSHGPRAVLYCALAFVAIEVVGHLVLVLRSPRDARAPKDEREQLIDLRATRTAYWVYVVGSFAAVHMLHHGADAPDIGTGVLIAFIVAQVVKTTVRIRSHRRGF